MDKIDFTLILACYNEGPTLLNSLKQIEKIMNDTKYKWECICINDSSRDNTYQTLQTFVRSRKNFQLYNHEKNIGRGGTVSEGIKKSKGRVVGFIDVDLEVSEIYIPIFIKAVDEGADIIIATRVYKIAFSNLIRALSTKVYVMLATFILDLKFKDTEAGYKFFNRKKILPILEKTKDKHWFFDTEIVARSYWSGLKIKEIPVLFIRRNDKASTVRLIPDTYAYLKALWNFKKSLQI